MAQALGRLRGKIIPSKPSKSTLRLHVTLPFGVPSVTLVKDFPSSDTFARGADILQALNGASINLESLDVLCRDSKGNLTQIGPRLRVNLVHGGVRDFDITLRARVKQKVMVCIAPQGVSAKQLRELLAMEALTALNQDGARIAGGDHIRSDDALVITRTTQLGSNPAEAAACGTDDIRGGEGERVLEPTDVIGAPLPLTAVTPASGGSAADTDPVAPVIYSVEVRVGACHAARQSRPLSIAGRTEALATVRTTTTGWKLVDETETKTENVGSKSRDVGVTMTDALDATDDDDGQHVGHHDHGVDDDGDDGDDGDDWDLVNVGVGGDGDGEVDVVRLREVMTISDWTMENLHVDIARFEASRFPAHSDIDRESCARWTNVRVGLDQSGSLLPIPASEARNTLQKLASTRAVPCVRRAFIWSLTSGGVWWISQRANDYAQLVEQHLGTESRELRHAPSFGGTRGVDLQQVHMLNSSGHTALSRVLAMLALLHPESCSFAPQLPDVAAAMLVFMSESVAFASCHALLNEARSLRDTGGRRYIVADHEDEAVLVDATSIALRRSDPKLWKHVTLLGVDISSITKYWFRRLFFGFVPYHTCLCILDAVLVSGVKALQRVAIGVFKQARGAMLTCTEAESVYSVVAASAKEQVDMAAWVGLEGVVDIDVRPHDVASLGAHRHRDSRSMASPVFYIPKVTPRSTVAMDGHIEAIWSWIPRRLVHCDIHRLYSSRVDGTSLTTVVERCGDERDTLLLISAYVPKSSERSSDSTDETAGCSGGAGAGAGGGQEDWGHIRIGAFITGPWNFEKGYKGDGQTFLFTLTPIEKAHHWVGNTTVAHNSKTPLPTSPTSKGNVHSSSQASTSSDADDGVNDPLAPNRCFFSVHPSGGVSLGAGGGGAGLHLQIGFEKGTTSHSETFDNPPLTGDRGAADGKNAEFCIECVEIYSFRAG